MEFRVSVPSGPLRLAGTLHRPRRSGRLPGVVLSHGLESWRGSGKLVSLARALEDGFWVLRFDQRGCGESPGDPRDLAGRLDDLRAALRFLRRLGARPVGLAGSSFGGYISVRVAAEERAGALATFACPYRMAALPDLGEPSARLPCPALFIHGTRDSVVPPDHSRRLRERAAGRSDLRMVEGADHRFSGLFHQRRAVALAAEWLRSHLL